MKREDVLNGIKGKFGKDIVDIMERSETRIYIEIKPRSLTAVAGYVFKDLCARFNIATGLDTPEHIEILYHFTVEAVNVLVSLRVKLDRAKPEIDSLTGIFAGSDWIEREMHELLGVNFRGHPRLERLLLPEEWPAGVYPLRRDYKEWDKNAIRDRGV